MKRFVLAVAALAALKVSALETQVLPASTFTFDFAYLSTSLDKQWSGAGKALPLVE